MTQPLNYATPPLHRRSRYLTFLANVTMLYPLFFVTSLYGQWLLSWYILGHRPIPSLDDPTHVRGANWMHPITFIALLGMSPFSLGALVFNVLHIIFNRVTVMQCVRRSVLLLGIWTTTIGLIRYDPQSVLYWWFD